MKQPGIFLFFLVGGSLFGFDEVGIHLFELLCLLLFSAVLLVTSRQYLENKWISRALPVLTVGKYYTASGSWHLTQVEAVVNIPIFLCLWFACTASVHARWRTSRLLASGLMASCVAFLKLILLPIPVAVWLVVIVEGLWREAGRRLAFLVSTLPPLAVGLLVPIAISVAYFAANETLSLVGRTFFVYPLHVVAQPSDLPRLTNSLFWFADRFASLLALGLVGVSLTLGARDRDAFKHRIVVSHTLWLALGLLLIVVQRMWWEYHYLLLFVPIGVLAVVGLDVLWRNAKAASPSIDSARGRSVLAPALCLLLLPSILTLASRTRTLARHGFGLDYDQRRAFQALYQSYYPRVLPEVKFLSSRESLDGDIYVFGTPLVYLLSGRGQAIAMNGWAIHGYGRDEWAKLNLELSEALPPYVFVQVDYEPVVRARSPGTLELLERHYLKRSESELGTWYVRINKQQDEASGRREGNGD